MVLKAIPSKPGDRIIVALDISNFADMINAVETLGNYISIFKVGLEAITSIGLKNTLSLLKDYDSRLLLDMKLHDIPNTMSKAAANIVHFNSIFGFTFHLSAGLNAMKEMARVQQDKLALGVTILTSIGADDAWIYGCNETPQAAGDFSGGAVTIGNKVVTMASQAAKHGIKGIVCSAKDLRNLMGVGCAKNLIKITPGIRPQWAVADDQKRITTPLEAIRLGADYLVIGRPILSPPNGMTPKDAVKRILEEINTPEAA